MRKKVSVKGSRGVFMYFEDNAGVIVNPQGRDEGDLGVFGEKERKMLGAKRE